MGLRTLPTLIAIAILCISLAGCEQVAQPVPEQKASPRITTAATAQPTSGKSAQQASLTNNHLVDALAFVPEGTTQVSFLDWEQFKAYGGASALTGKNSSEERKKFFLGPGLGVDQPA